MVNRTSVLGRLLAFGYNFLYMTPEQIKKKVLAYKDWEWWAERPFVAFILSLFKEAQTRRYHKKIGLEAEYPAMLYQKGAFYKSEQVLDNYACQLQKYIDHGGSIFKIVKLCEEYRIREKRHVLKLIKENKDPILKFKELYEILVLNVAYVWPAHGFEHIYKKQLYREAPKYCKGDIDKFIGDVSYPMKHNAHYFFEQALRGKQRLKSIQDKYGWIKVRDGFSEPYSIKELSNERRRLRKTKTQSFKRVPVPTQLKELVKIAQELVYFRTLRTDILYELMFAARPILKQVANYYQIPFKEMKCYSAYGLAEGKVKKYPFSEDFCAISVGPNFALLSKPILRDQKLKGTSVVGMIANLGLAQGRAKIVKTAYEIGKVKRGDIIFAPTTAPSFIIGMKKAAAFVTDEGGITSHAAIVSREMNKPCIIGTKIGTKIFKDGDLVEVDANKGIVRKIK